MKNTTLRQLTVFETVARHLHFTRAAEALGTTQPSVSMQIKQLEDNLGVALFEQVGKRVHLTEAGRELHRYCREISRQLAEAETALGRLKDIQGGQLRLAIAPTAKYFMPRLLAEFVRRYPGVVVDLRIEDRDAMFDQLEANERDMVVMDSLPQDPTLVAEPFLADPLVAIAAPGHALVGARAVPPVRLAQEPFLLREPGSETRHAIERFFAEQGLAVSAGMTVNSNEAIKQGVQAGLGVAIVPLYSISLEREVGRLAVLDIAAMTLQCSWHLAHRQEKRFSCVAEAFRNFVLQEARRHLAGSANPASPAQQRRAGG
jgi:DNA-binding transcriptional LysR family regulator